MGLGYLVNKSGNQRAFEYLTASLIPSVRTEGFFEAIKNMFTLATVERKLNKYAALGLALSGHPKATAALKSVRESVKSSEGGAAKDMTSEALRANREIAGGGLGEYYRSSRP